MCCVDQLNPPGDPAFRQRVRDWVAQLWADKDRRITQLLPGSSGVATVSA